MIFIFISGSTSDSPNSSLSKSAATSSYNILTSQPANGNPGLQPPPGCASGSPRNSSVSLNAVASTASAVSSGVGALSASANALDADILGTNNTYITSPQQTLSRSANSLNGPPQYTSHATGPSQFTSHATGSSQFTSHATGPSQFTSQAAAGTVASQVESKKPSQSAKQSLLQVGVLLVLVTSIHSMFNERSIYVQWTFV